MIRNLKGICSHGGNRSRLWNLHPIMSFTEFDIDTTRKEQQQTESGGCIKKATWRWLKEIFRLDGTWYVRDLKKKDKNKILCFPSALSLSPSYCSGVYQKGPFPSHGEQALPDARKEKRQLVASLSPDHPGPFVPSYVFWMKQKSPGILVVGVDTKFCKERNMCWWRTMENCRSRRLSLLSSSSTMLWIISSFIAPMGHGWMTTSDSGEP